MQDLHYRNPYVSRLADKKMIPALDAGFSLYNNAVDRGADNDTANGLAIKAAVISTPHRGPNNDIGTGILCKNQDFE